MLWTYDLQFMHLKQLSTQHNIYSVACVLSTLLVALALSVQYTCSEKININGGELDMLTLGDAMHAFLLKML